MKRMYQIKEVKMCQKKTPAKSRFDLQATLRLGAFVCLSVLASTVFGHGASGEPSGPAQATQVVGVSGSTMTLNGTPWLSRGVTLRGFVAPAAFLQANQVSDAGGYNAQLNYGLPELRAARAFGADTLRFQVSQPSLDPESPLYDQAYVAQVVAAMKFARQQGFVVMIMMQDEPFSGETTYHPLAIKETVRDWDYLNTQFGKDPGVLFELYNEPGLVRPTARNWALWANGDTNGSSRVAPGAVGMQTMINRLRREGCVNVFILDGLHGARTLENLPEVTDPMGQIVYAVHPYAYGSPDESLWDVQFGNISSFAPVYADEWSAEARTKLGLGALPNYQVAVDLLNYLRRHNISLGASAFDIPGQMVQNVPGWTPTNYDNFKPGNYHLDAGLLVEKLFQTDYKQRINYSDGVTP